MLTSGPVNEWASVSRVGNLRGTGDCFPANQLIARTVSLSKGGIGCSLVLPTTEAPRHANDSTTRSGHLPQVWLAFYPGRPYREKESRGRGDRGVLLRDCGRCR